MRHNRQTHRLGRNSAERKALFKNLVASLLTHQEIRTTLAKAKEAKRLVDHVITLGKADTLAARREVFSFLQDHALTSRIFKEMAPRFKDKKGGYTRVLRLQKRKGDGAELALLELTEKEIKLKEPKKPKKKEAEAKPAKEEARKEEHPKAAPPPTEKEAQLPKKAHETPKQGFFKNLGKLFRRKGFGNRGA